MAQDDVTNPTPLRGGRQRSNHIQTVRIEAGLKEREWLESYMAGKTLQAYGQGAGMVAAGAALGLAAFGLYWFFDAGWGIVERIESAAEKYWAEAKKGNVLYLQQLEVPEDYNAEEDSWMRSVGDGTPLDHKWWASLIGL